ncbi:MAG TPA: hypothetical protein ACQGQH_04385 [Xylella sp.]
MIGTIPPMPWSTQQLCWLQAMGYTIYLDRKIFPEPERIDKTSSAIQENGSIRELRNTTHTLEISAIEHNGTDSIPVPQRWKQIGLPDKLQIALLRACAGNPSDPQVQKIMAAWPLAQLRANPNAKRALWPQLRTIRRHANK